MITATLDLPARESFSKINPYLQTAWDSVSLGVAKTCWRKYYLQIILGWSPKHEAHHLRYGQLYHRALEVYDHKVFAGASHEDALRAALWDLKAGCTEPDGKWWNPHQWLSEEKAKRDTKTIANLFRTVVWYLDQFGMKDVCKTIRLADGKPAVELSFRYPLDYRFRTGEEALHSGHIDRLVDLRSVIYVLDRKTTGSTISGASSYSYFAKWKPDNQMGGYDYAANVVWHVPVKGVIIDAAQIAKGFSHFERGFVDRTPEEKEEWRTNTLYYIAEAEARAEQEFWPMNDTACDLYGGCVFRGICSKTPGIRNHLLKSDFVKRPWDPLKVRGDI